jgi:hypothetical protein
MAQLLRVGRTFCLETEKVVYYKSETPSGREIEAIFNIICYKTCKVQIKTIVLRR